MSWTNHVQLLMFSLRMHISFVSWFIIKYNLFSMYPSQCFFQMNLIIYFRMNYVYCILLCNKRSGLNEIFYYIASCNCCYTNYVIHVSPHWVWTSIVAKRIIIKNVYILLFEGTSKPRAPKWLILAFFYTFVTKSKSNSCTQQIHQL